MISCGKQPKTMETTSQLGTIPTASVQHCLLTSAPDTNKTFKSATLLRGLPNDTDAKPASKPISQILEEAQVLLLQSVMPISAGHCGQPPPLETHTCSSYSEVSHQIRHYI